MGGPVRFLLASGSPRRREILRELGWPFRVRPAEVDESPRPGEPPDDLVLRLARAKAEAARDPLAGEYVLAADTVVAIDGRILGKPADRGEAEEMIGRLNGRTHRVHTGIWVVDPEGRSAGSVERTAVTFRRMPPEALRAYVESGEGDDKAGAYAVQGLGALLVERLEGDYWNVVGLPVVALSGLLESLGIPLAEQWRMRSR